LEKIPEHVDTQMPSSHDGFQPGENEGGEFSTDFATTEPDPGCEGAYNSNAAVSILNSDEAAPLIDVRHLVQAASSLLVVQVLINLCMCGSFCIFQFDQPIQEIGSIRETLSGSSNVARKVSDDEPCDAPNNGEEGDTRSCSSSDADDDEDADDENDQGEEAPDVEEHSSNSDNEADDTNIREENEIIPPVIDYSGDSHHQRHPENGDSSRSSTNGDVGMQPRGLGHVRSNGTAADIGDLRHKLFACITNNAGTNDRSRQSSGNEGANGNQIEG
jgi:hypothetical protein